MNYNLEQLKPELVWKHFKAICQIPHPSHHEEKVREYIVEFAKAHNLEYSVDEPLQTPQYIRAPSPRDAKDEESASKP